VPYLLPSCLAAVLSIVRPLPQPVIIPVGHRADEKPVAVETASFVAVSNGLYRIVETTMTFVNSNPRPLAADLEFPLPDGATVCGYRLEISGEMVEGVICKKEKARVAFENEQRKGVDPGLVEQVKGNVWKTRIFPLPANGRRKAAVSYVVAEENPVATVVAERCGDYVYEGRATASAKTVLPQDRCRAFAAGWILWDASRSRLDKTAHDLALLGNLPEKGSWKVVIFRDRPEAVREFSSRAELVSYVSAAACDGGTDLAALQCAVPADGQPKLLFSDEIDTLNEPSPRLEDRGDLIFVSRPSAPARRVSVSRRSLAAGENVQEGRLLATAWAANHIADLSSQADSREDEFLALGREFGVASPVTSLIVLETLNQWLEHDIEPPKKLACHDEWVRRRAAQDDPIARKAAQADFERRLLKLWQERVNWWRDPKPPKKTPKSGLFEATANAVGDSMRLGSAPNVERERRSVRALGNLSVAASAEESAAMESIPAAAAKAVSPSAAATVKLAAWKPDMPYLKALDAAPKAGAYGVYLEQARTHCQSPAFYLDCAGWFFKAGETLLAKRIISNLAEFRLEETALWRTMGWRLREAAAYDEAVRAFRHVLARRGEEAHSARDLALVLSERGKARFARGDSAGACHDLTEALSLFHRAVFSNPARRSARRSNDIQVSIIALEEMNGILAWCETQTWPNAKPVAPELDSVYRRDLPMDLRIMLSWDADETDIDIHVLEPNGEEAYYSHRRTSQGGFVGEDVTTGYGPEEYLRKDAEKGVYKVLANYFASHQQALTGAANLTATVYTNWSRKDESRQILTIRLDKPKDKHLVGEVKID